MVAAASTLSQWRRHPEIDVNVGCQNDRHGVLVDRLDIVVGVRRQNRKEVSCDFPLFQFPYRGPSGPDTGEESERACFIEREPYGWTFSISKRKRLRLGKRGERHNAAMLGGHPTPPIGGGGIPDVCPTGIRLFALQQIWWRWRAPACHGQFPAFRMVAHDLCRIVRENARQGGRLPVRSRMAPAISLIACCPWSRNRGCTYPLALAPHVAQTCSDIRLEALARWLGRVGCCDRPGKCF